VAAGRLLEYVLERTAGFDALRPLRTRAKALHRAVVSAKSRSGMDCITVEQLLEGRCGVEELIEAEEGFSLARLATV
jgi:hypothetical protein